MTWPEGRSFGFSIIDDTDNSTVENVAPVYSLLRELGMRTTKTVWVYPPRDHFEGQCLRDPDYLRFVLGLKNDGFEIGLHNVGSGSFTRSEILQGLDEYELALGEKPSIHINHSRNPDNLYWGYKRFVPPLSWLFKLLPSRSVFKGDEKESDHFWADWAGKHIRYTRNLVFNGINTGHYDPRMPYRDPSKPLMNGWFSSSDAHTVEEFVALLSDENLDRLEKSGGFCLVYTHFASGFMQNGKLHPAAEERLRALAGRKGWFVPASVLLDHLAGKNGLRTVSYAYLLTINMKWLFNRVMKRLKFGR